MLLVSGNLKLDRPLGSDVATLGQVRVGRVQADRASEIATHHRSVYLPVIRNNVPEALALFDFAPPEAPIAKRDETNVPAQALYLLNNPFVLEQATDMAAQLKMRFEQTEGRIKQAFLHVYGRPPSAKEIANSQAFIESMAGTKKLQQPTVSNSPTSRGPRSRGRFQRAQPTTRASTTTEDIDPLALFCQSLLASAEFRMIN